MRQKYSVIHLCLAHSSLALITPFLSWWAQAAPACELDSSEGSKSELSISGSVLAVVLQQEPKQPLASG